MPQLRCTVRRVGDHESRTEEYEVAYALGRATPRGLLIKYQAARAYEINAALDAAVEVAREAIAEADPDQGAPQTKPSPNSPGVRSNPPSTNGAKPVRPASSTERSGAGLTHPAYGHQRFRYQVLQLDSLSCLWSLYAR